ncbi:hypothetical protein [Hahella ganghwensis]|uniref:hypothetical protein n=1 Tax=Hahella ganghwensis TaxID=286420 RepID=UPI0012FB6789|nr:hypothetical protein [Hahella ganghwensis]
MMTVGSHWTITATQTRGKSGAHIPLDADVLARVKRTIQGMEAHFQLFGHYMYGPFYDEVLDQVEDLVVNGMYKYVSEMDPKRKITTKRERLMSGLIRMLIRDHRRQVFGGGSEYVGAQKAGQFQTDRSYSVGLFCERLFDDYQVKVERKHWGRDCEPIYEAIVTAIDSMEKRTLKPVSVLLSKISVNGAVY